MDFAQTVIGNKICNLAAKALGKYTKETEQYLVSASVLSSDYNGVLQDELEKGAKYVSSFVIDDMVTFVLEKEKR